MADLSDSQAKFLRELFFEGYEGGRYRRLRWTREDLYKVYQGLFTSLEGFSETMDTLVFHKFVAMEVSPSRSLTHYYLPRMSIEYLAAAEPNVTIDSSSWTGLPSDFVFSPDRHETLVRLLREAEGNLDQVGATNEEKAMARSYIVAARILSDAPDPPIDVIWELISRANHLSGIAALLVSIVALFSVGK